MADTLVNVNPLARSPLAANLRRLRTARGLSAVELARRAKVSRATLTQLEAGGGNPTLETLYGLANALDAALADLIAPAPAIEAPRVVRAGAGTRVTGHPVEAWLLDTVAGPSALTEIYDFRLTKSGTQRSAAHPAGTKEHLYIHAGRIRVGPVENLTELAAGDFVTFDASTDHLYQRIGKTELRGLLVITHAGH
jgi:transcriptional regulator with XRE-family HTH domain